MKVVFLRSNPVNPDARVEKEVNSLLRAGHDVQVLAWDRDNKYASRKSFLDLEAGKATVYRFGIPGRFGGGMRNFLPLLLFQLKLYKWLTKHNGEYDVIHACDFDTSFTASFVARRFRKKLVYDIFDYYVQSFGVPPSLRRFIERLDHRVINTADAVILCTEKRREQIRGTQPKKVIVVHNTPSLNSFKRVSIRRQVNSDASKVKIVYVGVLVEHRFLKEIAETVRNDKRYEFHVGGFGKYEDYFINMSAKCENVIFYGRLPYARVLELENSCDIMVAVYDPSIPNHRYSAPNKFYEALMLGKPIIVARGTGIDEIVAKNDLGEVIDYDRRSFERGLDNLVERRSEWADMAERMHKLYDKEYSWDEMERRLIQLYEDLARE